MEALSVETLLGLVGLVILVGLAGEVGFKRTGIPSVSKYPGPTTEVKGERTGSPG